MTPGSYCLGGLRTHIRRPLASVPAVLEGHLVTTATGRLKNRTPRPPAAIGRNQCRTASGRAHSPASRELAAVDIRLRRSRSHDQVPPADVVAWRNQTMRAIQRRAYIHSVWIADVANGGHDGRALRPGRGAGSSVCGGVRKSPVGTDDSAQLQRPSCVLVNITTLIRRSRNDQNFRPPTREIARTGAGNAHTRARIAAVSVYAVR